MIDLFLVLEFRKHGYRLGLMFVDDFVEWQAALCRFGLLSRDAQQFSVTVFNEQSYDFDYEIVESLIICD